MAEFNLNKKKKVLMICLGNICRSPIAEAVFQNNIDKMKKTNDWFVDSAAIIAYHTGKKADTRALSVMRQKGLNYNNRARPITKDDFMTFDYIFGMDEQNMYDLNKMKPIDCKAELLMLGSFGLPCNDKIINDPYYDIGEEPFLKVFEQCEIACSAFLKQFYDIK